MIIVIQNCKTFAHLNPNAEWTDDVSAALTFATSSEALRFALQNDIPSAQIVLKFRNKNNDVVLPVSADCQDKEKAA